MVLDPATIAEAFRVMGLGDEAARRRLVEMAPASQAPVDMPIHTFIRVQTDTGGDEEQTDAQLA
jgi:hypothetical protein